MFDVLKAVLLQIAVWLLPFVLIFILAGVYHFFPGIFD